MTNQSMLTLSQAARLLLKEPGAKTSSPEMKRMTEILRRAMKAKRVLSIGAQISRQELEKWATRTDDKWAANLGVGVIREANIGATLGGCSVEISAVLLPPADMLAEEYLKLSRAYSQLKVTADLDQVDAQKWRKMMAARKRPRIRKLR